MLNGQQQEPYEGRSSRTVLWERRGEVPLRDPITHLRGHKFPFRVLPSTTED